MAFGIKITKQEAVEQWSSTPLRVRAPGTWDKYNGKKGRGTSGTLCVDGEGYTGEDGEHRYTYIAAVNDSSNVVHETRYAIEGLSSDECFWFLVGLPRHYRKVGFSFGYDVNMMLRDVDLVKLMILQEKGFVRWKGWRIHYIKGKIFSVRRRSKQKTTLSCTVWDIFGYFQKSFVRTIWEWQVGTEEELKLIADMKSRRAQFTTAESATISTYCKLECKLGSQVFDKLLKSTKDLGLSLRRYDGAGSIAAAMLRKHNVQAYMHQTTNRIPDEVIKSGYYGGRFDVSAFGECGDAIEYDINSAYPYQAVRLPCLSCGSWEYSSSYREDAQWAIWNVEWDIDKSSLWSPFPYRHKHGIYYLRNGSGWYWANEVREAKALYADAIRVKEGYIYSQQCDHVPFQFIIDYYQRRRRLKEAGDLAQMVIKLGLNSLYGKLAQNVGHRGTAPQTQCLIWAGIITSNTRAMLLSQICSDPDAALLLATDAVIRKSEANGFSVGDGLGQWEPIYLQKLFIICNGLYQAGHSGEVKNATRGFSSNDFYDEKNGINHWSKIRQLAAKQDHFKYHIPVTNFITLGEALNRDPKLDHWREWYATEKCLNYGNFKYKEFRDGRLYPVDNLWGLTPSQPFEPNLYRYDEAPLLDVDTTEDGVVPFEGSQPGTSP